MGAGHLIRLLPGVYGPDDSFPSRTHALHAWDENAILTGSTAARLSWWSELRDDTVRASSMRQLTDSPGFDVRRLHLPPDLVHDASGYRLVYPSLSVLQLIPQVGPAAIDEALRRRATSVEALHEALRLMPGRPGNRECLAHLKLSRDQPWSALEREAHQVLRAAGIRGWRANVPVRLPSGLVYLDVAFLRWRIAVELDGFRYHSDAEAFHADRRRDVELQVAGWRVLRFTAQTLDTMPEAVRSVLSDAIRRSA